MSPQEIGEDDDVNDHHEGNIEGWVEIRLYENHRPRYEYLLMEKRRALGPVIKALYDWGETQS